MNKNIWEVCDIEVFPNFFSYMGFDIQNKKWNIFIIHKDKNDYLELYNHIKNKNIILVGYNIDNYDYPVLHHLVNHFGEYSRLNGAALARRIKEKSDSVLNSDFNTVADRNKHCLVIDLFTIWHFNNLAKLTSLKDLQIAMRMKNVEDYDGDFEKDVTPDQIKDILSYNKNDVIATLRLLMITLGKSTHPMYDGKNKILLRQNIYNQFGLNCLNYDDIKVGTELILRMYCEAAGNVNPYQIRKMTTKRPMITGTSCIPKWAHFDSKQLNDEVLHNFKKAIFFDGITKGVLSFSTIYHNFKVDFGAGGAHGCIEPGVYDSDDEWMILDVDIASMYPNLAITQNIYPKHLGPLFIRVYGDKIVGVRMKEKSKDKKDQDMVIIEGYKLAANGTYGKTKEKNSWLYDPLYPIKTTISGQILLMMWMEYMVKVAPELIFIQVNTDGITIKCKRDHYDDIIKASDELMKKTGLEYETAVYDRMVIRDVNNYASRFENGYIKYKGAFEIDKELHKDPSMRIVPIALSKYFFEGIPVEETIKNHDNIFDFCMRLKTNKSCIPYWDYLDEDGRLRSKKLQRTTRYFISNSGGVLRKHFISRDSESGVNIGFNTTLFNKYYEKPIEDYNINYRFYISEANKIINIIEESKHNPTLFGW